MKYKVFERETNNIYIKEGNMTPYFREFYEAKRSERLQPQQ